MPLPWHPDDVVVLRRIYGTCSTARLCERLDRTAPEIEAKAAELRLGKDKRRFLGRPMPRWTDVELGLLRTRYATRSNQEIATELRRSVKSIQSKAFQLGLQKDGQRLREMGNANAALRRDRLKFDEA